MKKLLGLFFIAFTNLIFSQENKNLLHANFVEAMNTTNNIFIIINVKDLNTNEIREICTTNNQLREATKVENSITFDEAFDLLQKNKSRYFEFENKEALKIFNANNFSKNDLLEFEREIKVDDIIKNINKNWNLDYDQTQEKTYLFGYSLSKKGLLIGLSQECFGFNGLWCVSCQEK
jgi:hypothetical protein